MPKDLPKSAQWFMTQTSSLKNLLLFVAIVVLCTEKKWRD